MFEHQYIGRCDHDRSPICCGDEMKVHFKGGTEFVGTVKYDQILTMFLIATNDGTRFSFSGLDDEEATYTLADN